MIFNKKVLPNGMRIITVPMADNPSVTVLVMVETGSGYESSDINGLSHFLEHMVFKGTDRRPNASDISKELDALGAQYNAFTSEEYTGYYAKVDSAKFDQALDLISDLYINPKFDREEMEKEKGVIVEEIRMYEDLPQHDVQHVFSDLVYGDQPAGWSVLGTEEKVKSFTREQIIDYRKEHYVSGSTIVIVAGSFDEAEVIRKVEKAMAPVPVSKKSDKSPVKEKQDSPAIKLKFKETGQSHLVIGFRTFGINDKRVPVMSVLSGVLGKGMSSRLFTKLRDDLGLCYYVRAGHDVSTDHGILEISAGVDNGRLEEAVKAILVECRRLKDELVSGEELRKVKDFIAGHTMLDLETSDSRADFCASQEILKGKIESPEEILAKIEAVTPEEIQKLAREVIVNEGLNMAVIGRNNDTGAFKEYFKI